MSAAGLRELGKQRDPGKQSSAAGALLPPPAEHPLPAEFSKCGNQENMEGGGGLREGTG